jgi:hypothetical protein
MTSMSRMATALFVIRTDAKPSTEWYLVFAILQTTEDGIPTKNLSSACNHLGSERYRLRQSSYQAELR